MSTRSCLLSKSAVAIFCLLAIHAGAQSRPKLVVGIVVDQMRWDYLYRFDNRWQPNGGFRRMMDGGVTCDRTYLNYLPTYTACGHASIYSGSVPAIHGITGNQWWDAKKQRNVYCTSDTSVKTIGAPGDAGEMSPVNMLSNTICDELRLATNFRGKTVSIALKDRSAILPAGRTATGAYWYDGDDATWVTSSFYRTDLPDWVKAFKTKPIVDSFYQSGWNLLYPRATYTQSVAEKKAYEIRNFGSAERQFPYDLRKYVQSNYNVIESLPFGNSFTADFAKAAIQGEGLGTDSVTDFLAISFSSIDMIGHAFGPNSVEMEDAMLRLDIDLGKFLDYLDQKIGKGEYLLFLTADHGVSQVPGFLHENKMASASVDESKLLRQLNDALSKEFSEDNLCLKVINMQLVLNMPLIERLRRLNEHEIIDFSIKWLEKQEGINRAYATGAVATTTMPAALRMRAENGYYPGRGGQVQIIYQPGFIEGFLDGGTTHGGLYAYDTHIPLLWYGWKIPAQKVTVKNTSQADIAPSLAALLHIQEPNGSVGNVITDLFETSNAVKN